MDNLKPKQEQAAFLLASGKLGKDVAEAVGVTPETISHWKKDSAFEALTNKYKIDIMENVIDILRYTAGNALATLNYLIEHGSSETVKLKACSEAIKRLGFKNPEILVWGIGSTDAAVIEKTKK
jgi:uncharacterized protein YjcR